MTFIELFDVSFGYSKANIVLRNISVDFALGEQIAIIGSNGAGKTTLVKLITGMIKPQNGKILINRKSTDRMKIAEIAEQVGFVFQNPNQMLFANTVEKELELSLLRFNFSKNERKEKINDMLDFFSMDHLRDNHPRLISRGEKQKLAIASVLIQNPEAIIFDEPFSGIDITQRTIIANYIELLKKEGKLIILISHSLDLLIEHFDRVIALKNNEIHLDTTKSDFFKNPENLESIGLSPTTYIDFIYQLHNLGVPENVLKKSELLAYFIGKKSH
ncbi:MAG: ABC transporter ATP-binding protein [Asgard group archaeon]|nr:ABC transporter ATP-binding protein [Asgard group archaeon]